ncbi:MAG: LamG-like jellyroll fold domain-containing protein, partial [Phycisphaerae bacterium]
VLEGTEVVGTFKDGSAAVTRRTLGKGTVYYCAAGVWPGFLRQAVVEHLGSEIYAKVSGGGVDLVRTAQSNNGSEELLMLRGLGKKATVEWTLDFTPVRLYNPLTGAAIEAKINGNVVIFDVNIADWDFAWYAVRRPAPEGQFAHWLERQSEMWSGLVTGTPVAPVDLFRHLDLNRDWLLVQTKTAEEAAQLATLDDNAAGLKACPLVFWDAPGLDLKPDLKVGLYRRYFDLPKAWREDDLYDLRMDGRFHETTLHGFSGPARILMNGVEIWSGKGLEVATIKIPTPLKRTGNKLEIIHEGNGGMGGVGGVMADLALVRTVKADDTISLTGEWRAVDGVQTERAFTLPGKANTSFIYKEVMIPAQNAAQEIWLVIDTESAASANFAIVNGRKRYEILGSRDETRPLELNITPDVRFGASNRIVIGSSGMAGGWKKSVHVYKNAEIRCYEPGRWNADGKGIRTALNSRELEAARAAESEVALYPLVQLPVAKTPVSLGNFTPAELAAYMPPDAVLELKLDDAAGKISDLSRNAIPVKVHGVCTPFTERNGKIKGIYLNELTGKPGWLELPNAPMQNLMAGKSFTVCAWIKPLLKERDTGTLLRLGNSICWDMGLTSTNLILNSQWGDRLIVDCAIAPRQWQFVALAIEGNKGRMWIDGVDVGSKEWPGPVEPWHTAAFIGASYGTSDFCNFKLATLAVYPGALPETDVRKLFLKNRDRFVAPPNEVWPTDDLVGLTVRNSKLVDYAEIPSTVEAGSTLHLLSEEGHPVIRFDGGDSYLLFKEHPKVHILGKPFSMIMDIKPDEGAAGCLFRRYHDVNLNLEKDGTLRFDANIGQSNFVVFPKALNMGQWNRIMLTYDGLVISLFVDGKLVLRKDYVGRLSDSRYLMLCVGADNTWPKKNGKIAWQVPMSMREFRIIPRVMETVPDRVGNLDTVK